MSTLKTLKLTQRSPKQPVKKLPAEVELSPDATVEDVKVLIAKAVGLKDHHRIGLFDPETKRTLKDRQARIDDLPSVVAAGQVSVKDLGMQIAWRDVFLIEYFGPLLIHALFAGPLRPYIYANFPSAESFDLSPTQWVVFAMFQLHFLKRELETLFVHRFSAATMPWINIFRNSYFYWSSSGLLCAYFIYKPNSLAATADKPAIDAVGALIFLFGEICNAMVHQHLSSLRPPGSTERRIPTGLGFNIVTCPNYMFEIISWLGVIVASRSWAVAFFIIWGGSWMRQWGNDKEKAYRKQFGDKYKNKRYVMFPGIF